MRLSGCRRPTDPARHKHPSASSPGCGVSAVLHEGHSPCSHRAQSTDVVPKQRLLPVGQRVPWAGYHAHGMQTVKEHRRFIKKCSPVSVPQCPEFLPPCTCLCCWNTARWQRGTGLGAHGLDGRGLCTQLLSYRSDSEKL